MDNLISNYGGYGGVDTGFFASLAAYATIIMIFSSIVSIFMIVCLWKVFTKAGKPGWATLIPIYNVIVLLEIGGKSGAWILINLIPIVGQIIFLVISITATIEMCRRFGKSTGFGVLCLFFPIVGYPILAFSNATYQGVQAEPESSILDVNSEGVTEKQNFNYGYENQETTSMNPVNTSTPTTETPVEVPVAPVTTEQTVSNEVPTSAPVVEQPVAETPVTNEVPTSEPTPAPVETPVAPATPQPEQVNQVDRFHTPSALDNPTDNNNNVQ